MIERPALRQFCAIAERWWKLSEERRAYFAELYRTGRWRLYYSEDKLLERMRDVAGICDRWAQIVLAARDAIPKLEAAAEPSTETVHRDAA